MVVVKVKLPVVDIQYLLGVSQLRVPEQGITNELTA
jgi:hypothetical protein